LVPEKQPRPDASLAEELERVRIAHNDLVTLQRQANEKLVLAGCRAQEELDEVRESQRLALADTDLRRLREAELLATAEFRERMLGIIGHDLRNPLSTILMACGMMIEQGELSGTNTLLARRIITSGERMSRMIGQLVEFTQATLGGDFELALAASDLGDVCRNISEELRFSSSIKIELTSTGDLRGSWDADRLAAALSNIVGNAVDHATPESPVSIHTRADGSAVVTEITNQGATIAPEMLPVIFNAFRRGQASPNTRTGHLGLGLYIAAEIVRAHNGTLSVTSVNGTTTFTVWLPRVPAELESLRGRRTSEPGLVGDSS
jgi:signal transduction histidine kinase